MHILCTCHLDDLPAAVAADLEEGDVVMTLGAGSIERTGASNSSDELRGACPMPSPTMTRQLKILAVTAAIGPLAFWGPGVIEAASGLEVFAVREVEVTGNKILTEGSGRGPACPGCVRLRLGATAEVWARADHRRPDGADRRHPAPRSERTPDSSRGTELRSHWPAHRCSRRWTRKATGCRSTRRATA